MPSLAGRRILITGGTSGVGRACVESLSAEGAHIAFTGSPSDPGRAVADPAGGLFVPADARDETSIRASIDAAAESLGGLDGLVCVATTILEAPLTETSLDEWQTLLDANLTASYLYSALSLPLLREASGGSIVHVASDAGVWGDARVGAYSVSNAALITLAQMLAIEAGPDGITVNAVCPGGLMDGPEPAPRLVPPVGRLQTPDEVAGVVAFLLGPDARFVNGVAMLADGGIRAGYRAWSVQE